MPSLPRLSVRAPAPAVLAVLMGLATAPPPTQAEAPAAGAPAAGASAAGASAAPAGEAAGLARTHDAFCAVVQRRFTGTTLPIRNALHAGWQPFVESKPVVQPLETQQYVLRADGQPLRISCKTKTADHIRAVHQDRKIEMPPTASSCRDLNREIVLAAWRSLGAAQRAAAPLPPTRLMLDPDRLRYTGSGWVSDYPMLYAAADGSVHLQAQALHADWEDWRWKLMPESWRGTRYCHLIAPEHARRLMLGEVAATAIAAD